MELNLAPQFADQTVFEGEGGSYYSWTPSKSPFLSDAKVGAGKLVLHPRGFALPHHADSSKIGYVLEGSCTVGMIPADASEEKVFFIKKGDAVPVQHGAMSWWFNGGDTAVVIVFLGDTTKALTPGQFTYFFLTGTLGYLRGFSTEFLTRVHKFDEKDSEKLAKSQTGTLIIKVNAGIDMPKPCKTHDEKIMINIDNALPDIKVKNGGTFTSITGKKFPSLGAVGLSASIVKLKADAVFGPVYTADSYVEIIYITKGSGRVQIVGPTGQNVLDSKVEAGHLFIFPPFFTAAIIADEDELEWFSVTTSPEPAFGKLAGNASVWKALSPSVVQASLAVTPEFLKIFSSNIEKNTIITPP